MNTTSIAVLVVVGVVGIFGLIFLTSFLRRGPVVEHDDLSDGPGFIKWLHTYEIWYAKSAGRISWVLYVCRITPIFIGFVVAIVSALDTGEFPPFLPQKVVVIILTGLSTFCVALITQFSLPELAKAREFGRIACAGLVARARLFFSIDRQPAEALVAKIEIRDRIFQIEEEQAALFYALSGNAHRGTSVPPGQQPPHPAPAAPLNPPGI